MIAVTPSIAAFLAWLDANPDAAALDAQRTPSVRAGDVAAARLAPYVVVPDGCPVEVYPQLSQAMAAYPDLPWHQLSVWSGTPPEPELVAAQEAFAGQQTEQEPQRPGSER